MGDSGFLGGDWCLKSVEGDDNFVASDYGVHALGFGFQDTRRIILSVLASIAAAVVL